MDHSTPDAHRADLRRRADRDRIGRAARSRSCETELRRVRRRAARPAGSEQRGIVHIIGPELGLTQPGQTIVCGDSHTSTHGAFGALAFGIGTTEVGHVLATQCLLQRRPQTFAIHVDGALSRGVTAKDLILAIIGQIGVAGGTGHVLEYRGSAIRALGMEERMTVCNMSIEAGARAGMIAPDETTYALSGSAARARRRARPGSARWRAGAALPSDAGRALRSRGRRSMRQPARADDHLRHQPGHGRCRSAARSRHGAAIRCSTRRSPTWGCTPAQPIGDQPVNVVFIGSCTNGRLSDLRSAARRAARAQDRRAACALLVVPGLAAGQATRPRPRGSTACSSTPAPSGASRAARCASA